MSYSSRVHRQRNPHGHEEPKQKAFFSGLHEDKKPDKKSNTIQAKLSVNAPGDSYEREADAVANSIVGQPSKTPVVQQRKISSVQRLSTPAEEEQLGTNDARMKRDKDIQEKPLQAKEGEPMKEEDKPVQKADEPKKEEEKPIQKADEPKKEEEKPIQKADEQKREEEKPVQKMDEPKKEEEKPIQKKASGSGPSVSPSVASYIDQSASKGSPLPSKALHEMNSGFGVDFSKVRIHNDNDAITANKQLESQAFTHGNDVYFNQGKFDPDSASGKFLLAHELTHVIQQSQGGMEKQVNRQVSATQPGHRVAGITSPVPQGLLPGRNGEYVTMLNGIKVVIRKDTHSKVKGKGAETKFKQTGGEIFDVKTKDGKILSFRGPKQVIVAIQTIYQRSAKATDTSTYGRGTTTADITQGDTSLGFHEGSHGTDYLNYLSANALPVFGGAVGMTKKEFEAQLRLYTTDLQDYFAKMAQVSKKATDCVGTTIDQLTGSSVCVP